EDGIRDDLVTGVDVCSSDLRHRRETASRDDLREQPTKRVADHRRLLVQTPHDPVDVIGDLAHRLAGEHVWMRLGVGDGFGVVRRSEERRVGKAGAGPGWWDE